MQLTLAEHAAEPHDHLWPHRGWRRQRLDDEGRVNFGNDLRRPCKAGVLRFRQTAQGDVRGIAIPAHGGYALHLVISFCDVVDLNPACGT